MSDHRTYKFVNAEVLEWSEAATGDDVVTFLLEYPRWIHPQMMAHRMAARNAQSSRAVPTSKLIKWLDENGPVKPIAWGSNKPGMVAGEPLLGYAAMQCSHRWRLAYEAARNAVLFMTHAGCHKQVANRLLEPFTTIKVVLTMQSHWIDHFLGLRLEHDAQPEIQALAQEMCRAMGEFSTAGGIQTLNESDWHLPFVTDTEREMYKTEEDLLMLRKASAARCARASYLNFDGDRCLQKDVELYDRLSKDKHYSPLEHVVRPRSGEWGIFDGWCSQRYYEEITR